MAAKSSKPMPHPLLEPFASTLPQTPERQMMSGAGLAMEAARFWTHRARAYAAYFSQLANCTDLAQASALQSAFWEDLQRDYANEGAALAAAATLTGLPGFARDASPIAWPTLAPRSDRAMP